MSLKFSDLKYSININPMYFIVKRFIGNIKLNKIFENGIII